MHSSIALTTAIAALTLAAPTPASAPLNDLFYLQTAPHNKARTEYTQYLGGFHVGAGEAAIVGHKNSTDAAVFYIDPVTNLLSQYTSRTDIAPSVVGLINQAPYKSTAPAGYKYVSLDIGDDGTKGWVKIPNPDGTGNVVVYEGKSPAVKAFALCHVNGVSPYFSVGPQYQLLWETPATIAKFKDCANVALAAIKVAVPN